MATTEIPWGEPSPAAARAAHHFVNSEGFAEWVKRVEYRHFQDFRNTEPGETEAREGVYASVRAMGRLLRELQMMANQEEMDGEEA